MTAKQIEDWKVERDIARDSGRQDLIQRAYDHRDEMMMECIQHQADRVKQGLLNDERFGRQLASVNDRLGVVESEIKPLKTTAKDYNDKLVMAKGAHKGIVIFVKMLKYAGAALGGGAVLKLLGL